MVSPGVGSGLRIGSCLWIFATPAAQVDNGRGRNFSPDFYLDMACFKLWNLRGGYSPGIHSGIGDRVRDL